MMKQVTLGKTGIVSPQNAFGCLPIQRDSKEKAVSLLRRAYDGGMRYFDTARAYSDSEEKVGEAFAGMKEKVFIATKTQAKTPEVFWKDLETSLKMLRTDYIDVYQFHMADTCYRPGDGTGMYECMVEAKAKGLIRHIGVTAHKIQVAFDCVNSGLYETLQFPFSYLASPRELELVRLCQEKQVGFICMKGLAGGLITRSDAAMAFMSQYENALPIWGIQRDRELDEWLSYMDETPDMTDERKDYIEKEQAELSGDFCRGCGYCMPCPMGIQINNCARMSLMLRRAPSKDWLNEKWQTEMKKIETCVNCRQCTKKCPYELSTPELLKKNYEDYKKVLAGTVRV
jgi:predicted aldo/keto reductase-like oxidoreductase